jgi:hypothetical protein
MMPQERRQHAPNRSDRGTLVEQPSPESCGVQNVKMSIIMKLAAWVTVLVLLAVLWISVRARLKSNSPNAQQSAKSQRPNPEIYFGLRNLMLQGSRAKFGIPAASNPTQPYGVLMDWGIPTGSATVVALADGTASVYLSSGGGFLGGGQSHETVRAAAKRTVEIAEQVQPLTQMTISYALPQSGQVTFYLLTDVGVFTATAPERDLRSHQNPLYKLGDAAQTIITEYRLIQEQK